MPELSVVWLWICRLRFGVEGIAGRVAAGRIAFPAAVADEPLRGEAVDGAGELVGDLLSQKEGIVVAGGGIAEADETAAVAAVGQRLGKTDGDRQLELERQAGGGAGDGRLEAKEVDPESALRRRDMLIEEQRDKFTLLQGAQHAAYSTVGHDDLLAEGAAEAVESARRAGGADRFGDAGELIAVGGDELPSRLPVAEVSGNDDGTFLCGEPVVEVAVESDPGGDALASVMAEPEDIEQDTGGVAEVGTCKSLASPGSEAWPEDDLKVGCGDTAATAGATPAEVAESAGQTQQGGTAETGDQKAGQQDGGQFTARPQTPDKFFAARGCQRSTPGCSC